MTHYLSRLANYNEALGDSKDDGELTLLSQVEV